MLGAEQLERCDSKKRRRLSERRRVFSKLGNRYPERDLQSASSSSASQPTACWSSASWSSSSQRRRQQRQAQGSVSSTAMSPEDSPGQQSDSLRSDSPSLLGPAGDSTAKIPIKIQFHITVAPDDEPLILVDSPPATSRQDSLVERRPAASRRPSEQAAAPSALGEQLHERLQRQHQASQRRRQQLMAMHDRSMARPELGAQPQEPPSRSEEPPAKELIYFKRDGQRFGHEFTLKLAVDRTYRCLLKIRPLIPVASISVQGHQVQFADCSQLVSADREPASPAGAQTNGRRSLVEPDPGAAHSAPAGSSALDPCWRPSEPSVVAPRGSARRLNHAKTTSNLASSRSAAFAGKLISARQRQRQQMLRHFAASHCSSSISSAHLGNQLIYMFDWPASRFEVNKNKNRTEIHTVVKFVNGQILSLPMQIKFYQSECRQHLSWGNQLHFVDFDCQLNHNSGNMSVHRIQYY